MTKIRTNNPPPKLLSFARQHGGEVLDVRDLSWDHGESAVWQLQTPSGEFILKAHRQGRKFSQELTAYREWLPRLQEARQGSGGRTGFPGLVASRSGAPRALLLTFEPGDLLQDLEEGVASGELGQAERLAAFQAAGTFLRRLHDLPLGDDDPLPLADAYALRADSWLQRARDVVPEAVRDWVAQQAEEAVPVLRQQVRVPTHRDYTPRNWLLERSTGRLTIFDFEHSRPDLLVGDFERLWGQWWPRDPAGREAFMDGYGRELSGAEEALLERIAALGGLTTVVWAREHRDREFERQGWEVLARLGCPGV